MKIGYLIMNKSGRYELRSREDEYLTYFTSGDEIEVWEEDKEQWLTGRVEHSDHMNGYYFYSNDGNHDRLWNGRKAKTL